MIEIARNLIADDLKILIMDEPTSSLSEQEVQVLFKIMRELMADGISIVYISHRLEEIMQIGDYVTILRDGKFVASAAVKDIDVSWIVKKMVGAKKSYPQRKEKIDWSKREVVLEVKDLCLPKKGGGWLLNHVNFELRRGEILGIYGLMGAGRTEVFECIMGLRPEHTGEILLNGQKIDIKDVSAQIDNGFAWVPEDRQREGLVQTLDIGKNISLASLKAYAKGLFLQSDKEEAAIDQNISDIHIKVADKRLPILSLSGGMIQNGVTIESMGVTLYFSIPLVVLITIICGATVGLINGAIITKFGVAPFIATLGTMYIARGFAMLHSSGATYSNILGHDALGNVGFTFFGGRIAGIPVGAIILAVIAIIAAILLKRTVFGWHIFAIGGNEKAAKLSGVKTDNVKILVYIFSAICATIVGLITTAQLEAAHPASGETWEMNAIAAAVLGGTSMAGGIGTIGGTIIGAFVIGVISDGMVMCGVSEFWQMVIKGLVIIRQRRVGKFPQSQNRYEPSKCY